MKKIFLILLIQWLLVQAHAQIGISAGYSTFDISTIADRFDDGAPNENDRTAGLHLSADYWFRLKQKRVEFLPTLYYTNHYKSYKVKNYGFQFRTTIYPFDFDGDCNCPTFSKENDLIKKGFFLRLSPGIGHWSTSYESPTNPENNNLDAWAIELSGAMGLDIGITNLLTVSPEIRYRTTFETKWNPDVDDKLKTLSFFEAVVRFGLRFDKKNYGFKPPRRRRR